MADISAGGAVRTLGTSDLGLGQEAQEAHAAAAERFAARTVERTEKIERLNAGATAADTPERMAKRGDRLRRYHAGEQLRSAPVAVPAAEPEAMAVTEAMLEKVINLPDFIDIRYLEAGVAASRAVGRIDIRNQGNRVVGYGTASLVSAQLVLTNHHVLPTADVARWSTIQFNLQDGIDGQPLQPRMFRLDPDRFYLSDKERDFAFVAVAASERELAEFGFNRLIDAEGKVIVGENVTIVQHPRGEKKQVSLRENRLVDVLDSFLHYETDTEPGSSGSPVFNDQWEVVALHHASVPAPDHAELGSIANEGVRVSTLLKAVRALSETLPEPMRKLLDGLFQDVPAPIANRTVPPADPPVAPPAPSAGPVTLTDVSRPEAMTTLVQDGLRLTLPIEITLRLGTPPAPTIPTTASLVGDDRSAVVLPLPVPAAPEPDLPPADVPTADVPTADVPTADVPTADVEAIRIDPDYADRKGYDPAFLGAGTRRVALPILAPALVAKASINAKAPTNGPRHVFPYHHFSVVMNKERALAFFTAVNIDGTLSRRLKREPDRWALDPRLPRSEQTGESVYADNDLDRGHLVRRLDPAWGTSVAAAKLANDDTFHFTNCSPQHKDFNQNQTTWAGLEDYVLESAENNDLKVSVFSGPVLAADDDRYRGVQLPRQFWKVVAMARRDGTLSATGYLLSQAQLVGGLEAAAAGEFSYGAYRTFQVPVAKVEELTGLSFGTMAAADPLARPGAAGLESAAAFHEVASPDDLVL